MNHLIISPLDERRVYIAKRDQPFLGQTGRKCDCMPFGNTHVIGPIRVFLHQEGHGATCRHSRGDPDDTLVSVRQLHECMPEHILKLGWLGLVLSFLTFSRFDVEFARCMPDRSLLLGRRVALTFDRSQVQDLRPGHILDLIEYFHQAEHIIAIDGAEIADAESFE